MDEPLGALDKQAARPDAARDQAHPARARHHRHLRHARPGRGDDDVRSHLPDERRRASSSSVRRRSSTSVRATLRRRLPRRVEPLSRSPRRRRLDGLALRAVAWRRARASAPSSPLAAGQRRTRMVRPQNLAIAPAATDGGTVQGRVPDVMVSGASPRSTSSAPRRRRADRAAYPTRRASDAFQLGQQVSLRWHEATRSALARRSAALSAIAVARRKREHAACTARTLARAVDGGAAGAAARRPLLYPVGQLLLLSVQTGPGYTLAPYRAAVASSVYIDVLLITFKISFWTTLFSVTRRLSGRVRPLDLAERTRGRRCVSGCCCRSGRAFWSAPSPGS